MYWNGNWNIVLSLCSLYVYTRPPPQITLTCGIHTVHVWYMYGPYGYHTSTAWMTCGICHVGTIRWKPCSYRMVIIRFMCCSVHTVMSIHLPCGIHAVFVRLTCGWLVRYINRTQTVHIPQNTWHLVLNFRTSRPFCNQASAVCRKWNYWNFRIN